MSRQTDAECRRCVTCPPVTGRGWEQAGNPTKRPARGVGLTRRRSDARLSLQHVWLQVCGRAARHTVAFGLLVMHTASLLQSLYCILEPQTSGGTKALRIRALRLVPQFLRWLSPSKILVSNCKPTQEGHALPHAILRLGNSECKAWILGSDSTLIIISGTNGELVATCDHTQRWELVSQ